MLKQAIEAQLPLVATTTRDILNLPDVLRRLSKRSPVLFTGQDPKPKSVCYMINPTVDSESWAKFYGAMLKTESTLVVVNPKVLDPMLFDVGPVPVPKDMMLEIIQSVIPDLQKAKNLMRGLGGCTIKEVTEYIRLTAVRDNSVTLEGIVRTRKSSFQGANGLTLVDGHQDFYDPPDWLQSWVVKEKAFFLECADHRLIPRGLLFDGRPGTGKTAGAKWMAAQLGVPLYRLDVGGTKNKYVGESEGNMLANLARLDNEEPCVLLIDEVEKVFSSQVSDSSGTTSTMMSQLLWWLAEHRTRVLTVMTSNNVKALPKELYRDGRIDQVLTFDGLAGDEAALFVQELLKTFKTKATDSAVNAIVKKAIAGGDVAPQAALTKGVYDFVKQSTKFSSK